MIQYLLYSIFRPKKRKIKTENGESPKKTPVVTISLNKKDILDDHKDLKLSPFSILPTIPLPRCDLENGKTVLNLKPEPEVLTKTLLATTSSMSLPTRPISPEKLTKPSIVALSPSVKQKWVSSFTGGVDVKKKSSAPNLGQSSLTQTISRLQSNMLRPPTLNNTSPHISVVPVGDGTSSQSVASVQNLKRKKSSPKKQKEPNAKNLTTVSLLAPREASFPPQSFQGANISNQQTTVVTLSHPPSASTANQNLLRITQTPTQIPQVQPIQQVQPNWTQQSHHPQSMTIQQPHQTAFSNQANFSYPNPVHYVQQQPIQLPQQPVAGMQYFIPNPQSSAVYQYGHPPQPQMPYYQPPPQTYVIPNNPTFRPENNSYVYQQEPPSNETPIESSLLVIRNGNYFWHPPLNLNLFLGPADNWRHSASVDLSSESMLIKLEAPDRVKKSFKLPFRNIRENWPPNGTQGGVTPTDWAVDILVNVFSDDFKATIRDPWKKTYLVHLPLNMRKK